MNPVEDFLQHYGVKGMRWGQRRSRNVSTKPVRDKTTYRKAPKQLSDAELNRRIRRLELEKKYNELNQPHKSEGKKYVDDLLKSQGKTVVGAVVGGAAGFFIQRALRSRFG